jgi:hypothetical protein
MHANIKPVFGVLEPREMLGFPAGKVRIKMRHDNFARVFVKTCSGILETVPMVDADGNWHFNPRFTQAINWRAS